MSDAFSVACPHCHATLKLKERAAIGKKARCPKCRESFVVESPKTKPNRHQTSVEPAESGPPPVVAGRRRKRKKKQIAEEAAPPRSGLMTAISMLAWLNAHVAAGVLVVDLSIDAVAVVNNWDQAVVGRFAVRALGRLVMTVIFTLAVWYTLVLPRDIGQRPAVFATGGLYLLVFSVIALAMRALVSSVTDQPLWDLRWSAIWFGGALLLYGAIGYPHESARQRAERLMANGDFNGALTAIEKAMEEEPGDDELYEMKTSIREMLRYS